MTLDGRLEPDTLVFLRSLPTADLHSLHQLHLTRLQGGALDHSAQGRALLAAFVDAEKLELARRMVAACMSEG